MSEKLTAAEKAVDRIQAYYEDNPWDKADGLGESMMEENIQAAIDEQTEPLVEALRQARDLLIATRSGGVSAVIEGIDVVLASFEEPEGGPR